MTREQLVALIAALFWHADVASDAGTMEPVKYCQLAEELIGLAEQRGAARRSEP